MLCPAYTMPTRKKNSNSLISRIYNEIKENVKNKLSLVDAVCLTTDGWTSLTQQSYIAITAHFIKEINGKSSLQSCLPGCSPCDNSHTSLNLSIF